MPLRGGIANYGIMHLQDTGTTTSQGSHSIWHPCRDFPSRSTGSVQQMQMYKIIELRDFDVLLPFVCRKCGSCCHGFAPQIIAEDLPRIGQHIGKPSEEIMKLHKEAYRKKFTDSPINCSFLNNKNQCSIYSMRPEPCQLYPLETDFGTLFHKVFCL